MSTAKPTAATPDNQRWSSEPASIAAYYDAWTDRYLDCFGESIQAHRPESEESLLDYLFSRIGLRDGQRVLDAGCGVCGPARYFAAQADVQICALTLSARQAEIARVRNEEAGLAARVEVSVGDFHDLPAIYGRERFDVVYCLESLSHSPDPLRAIRGAYEVLEPGGFLYIKDYFIRPCDDPEEQARVLDVVERVDGLFATKTAWSKDIRRCLDAAGFLGVFAERPRFEVNNRPWQQFEKNNNIDLFRGQDSFDWSEWLEIKSQKP